MEPERGLRERLRDWRSRRRRNRSAAPETTSHTSTASASTSQDNATSEPVTTENDVLRGDQAVTHDPTKSESHQDLGIPIVVPAIMVREPTMDTVPPRSLEDESSLLWKKAYKELRDEKRPLMENYEAVLKAETDIPQAANLQEQLAKVSDVQRKKAENKQWTFQWFGKKQTVRDIVERILNLANRWASLISIGMTYTPPYVSIPWSAITVLIPLMMNDVKEHRGSIESLEMVAKLTFSYQMAERAFLGRNETRDDYTKSVMGLYKKILEYQALAVEYFGKSTLRRLGKNVTGSTAWADMPAEISSLDDGARRSLQFLGQEHQNSSLETIKEFLKRQEYEMSTLIQKVATERDHVAQVTAWVTPISFQLDHLDVREKLGEDHFSSGNWYFQDQKLQNWRTWTEGTQYLWLRGGIGTGKSSLTSILIEDLIRTPDGLVAFFYCSRKADKGNEKLTSRNNHENILRSLLSQVAVSVDGTTVHETVVKRFNQDPRQSLAGIGVSGNTCVEVLDEIFASNRDLHYTLVIDALDECMDYDKLLELLKEATESASNVRIVFTSRFHVRAEDVFPDIATVTIASQNKDDIQSFLEIEIPKRRVGSGMTDTQATTLRKLLIDKASGMFMWVKLQLNLVLNEIKSKRIRLEEDIQPKIDSLEAAEAIGEELLYTAYNDVYEIAVGGTSQKRRKEIVTTALRWTLCAYRSLTLRELAYATSVRPDGTIASSVQEGLVLEFCSNLLIEDTVGIVRLPHLSVRHYLESRIPSDFEEGISHLQAALTCLYFASSPHFHEIVQSRSEVVQQGNVTLTKTFYSYVSNYWSTHCRQASRTEELEGLIKATNLKSKLRRTQTLQETSDAKEEHQQSSQPTGGRETAPDDSKRETKDTTNNDNAMALSSATAAFEDFLRLIYSVSGDSYDFIAQYIARGSDLEIRNSSGSTLLHESIRLRQTESVQALIDAGAFVDAQDHLGYTPMHVASMHAFDDGVQLLLRAGADRNSRNARGETPLHVSVMFGAREVTDTILSANADALAKDHQGNTPLHYAATLSQVFTLELLLLMGYNPDGRNHNGDTALSLAIKLGNEGVVGTLLSNDAHLTEEDRALAMSSDSSEIIRLVSQFDHPQARPPEPSNPAHSDNSLYRVKFPDSGSPCHCCNVTRWLIASRTGTNYPHHQSMQNLYASAENGCPLCAFFKQELEQQHGDESLDSEGKLVVTIDPSYTQGSRLDRKDKLVLLAGDIPLLTYELCIDSAEDRLPVLDWITGISTSELSNSPLCLQTVRNWISVCNSDHEACSGNEDPYLPTRFIDVGDDSDTTVRLRPSQLGERGKYVYLSFIWGGAKKIFRNTTSLMEFLQREVPPQALPQTLRDAVFMTRVLGVRYLWIDALCVIQDSMEDMSMEIGKMEQYLRGASFGIVAASGENMDSGLFQTRQQPLLHLRLTQHAPRTGDGFVEETGSAAVYLRRPLETAAEALSEHILTRAWLFQELVLPRRHLIMGANQLYWQCRASLRSEGNTLVQKPFFNLLPRNASKQAQGRSFLPWYNFIQTYSPSKTTVFRDRLFAVGGVARYFDGTSRFICGLWADDLRNGLLWYVDDTVRSIPMDDYIAPSWSWASIQCQVNFNLLMGCLHDRSPRGMALSVLDAVCDSDNETAKIAYFRGNDDSVKREYLKIKGMTLETSAPGLDQKYVPFFDSSAHEEDWRAGHAFILLFVCPWGVDSGAELKGTRSLGLILRGHHAGGTSSRDMDNKEYFVRVGIFLMDPSDGNSPGWKQKTFDLY